MARNWQGFWLLTTLKFKKMFSFKANLIAQAVAMIINNLGFLVAWGLLFSRFGSINGYTIKEIVLIQGFVSMFYALFFLFIGGVPTSLFEYLESGRFIDLMIYPVNSLVVLSTKSGNPTQIGDFLEGLILVGIYIWWYPSSWPLILGSLLLIVMGVYGLTLLTTSFSFFMPGSRDFFSKLVENFYVGGSTYPSENFRGIIRVVLYATLLIPVVSYPVEAVRQGYFPIERMLITITSILCLNFLGWIFWKKGVKKVESGSSSGIIE